MHYRFLFCLFVFSATGGPLITALPDEDVTRPCATSSSGHPVIVMPEDQSSSGKPTITSPIMATAGKRETTVLYHLITTFHLTLLVQYPMSIQAFL